MLSYRNNRKPAGAFGAPASLGRPAAMAEAGNGASQRVARDDAALPAVVATPSVPGDIIYGARAIARYLFGEDDNRARRRVFNVWTHYRDRQEKAGFFKLKGALCLSKTQWQDFHGLG